MTAKTIFNHASLAAMALTLVACAAPQPDNDISPRARAALPKGQDLSLVRKDVAGCYSYVKKGTLSGTQLDLYDAKGRVCDPLVP